MIIIKKLTKKKKRVCQKYYLVVLNHKILGSISYKDTETQKQSQQIQSVETTASVVTETFQAEEKIYHKIYLLKNNMNLQQVF